MHKSTKQILKNAFQSSDVGAMHIDLQDCCYWPDIPKINSAFNKVRDLSAMLRDVGVDNLWVVSDSTPDVPKKIEQYRPQPYLDFRVVSPTNDELVLPKHNSDLMHDEGALYNPLDYIPKTTILSGVYWDDCLTKTIVGMVEKARKANKEMNMIVVTDATDCRIRPDKFLRRLKVQAAVNDNEDIKIHRATTKEIKSFIQNLTL